MDERSAAIDMVKRIDTKDPFIVIMDRGYDGFNMLANMPAIPNCNYIIRTKTGTSAIKEIQDLPDAECDREITFTVTSSARFYDQNKDTIPNLKHINHMNKQYKAARSKNTHDHRGDFGKIHKIKVRIVKFQINDPDTGKEIWEVLLTNLNRFEFSLERMKEMYHMRWGIETSFRELKYAIGAVQFHSKKDAFVQMELYAAMTFFNAVARSVTSAIVPVCKKHKHPHAIKFKDAVAIHRKYFRLYNKDSYDRIEAEILSYTYVIQPGRKDKRKMRAKSAVYFVYRVA